jgi:DNA-binding transcriptional ArsR family regulator
MTPADATSAAEFIDLTELDRRPLRVAQSMLPSVLALVGDALGTRRHGAPEAWRREIRGALGRRDLAALLTVFAQRPIVIPDCLSPIPPSGRMCIRDTVALIAATDPDAMLSQAAVEYGDSPPPAWRHVESRPERWLEAFAVAVGNAATAIEPVWRSAEALLDRETERVGTAAMLGAARELLAGLHTDGRLDGDRLVLHRQGTDPVTWSLPDDGLALVPMLGGDGALVSWHRCTLVTHLAYPIPGRARLVDHPQPPAGRLDALLGGQRALILRLLDRPARAGAIAGALHVVPSVATHHVTALEKAGLVVRERHGQYVVVRRSRRGTMLLALYEL